MIIAIKSCGKDRDRGCHDAIRRSWGHYADVRFFMGAEAHSEDEIELPVNDTYPALPFKVRAMCQWLMEHNEDAFLCDNDTFVHPGRLVPRGDYYGRFYYSSTFAWATQGPRFAFGGTGYYLSTRAASLVAASMPDGTNEDEWVGRVLSSLRVEANNERFERHAAWHFTKNLYEQCPRYTPESRWQDAMTLHHIEGQPQDWLMPLDQVTFPKRVVGLGKTNPVLVHAKLATLANGVGTQEDLMSLAALLDIEKKPLHAVTLLEWQAAGRAYALLGQKDLSNRCLSLL